MKKKLFLLGLVLVIVMFLVGCWGLTTPPSLTLLTSEQVAQIEATSQDINNVLLQAEDPRSPEALEAAKQAALSQPTVEQAVVAEDSLVVKYKDGGFEVWQGDIPKPTPPADIAELQELTRSVLAETRATRAPVGTRQAVLISSLSEDPAFVYSTQVFNEIEQILITKGFTVKPLYGSEASISNLKQLSDYSVIVMLGHGGKVLTADFPIISFAYNVQTGETWREELYDVDWTGVRVVKVNVPWGAGDEKTRKKNSKAFAATTGSFWSYYYDRSHFNNGLFLNLACSSSNEAFREELFKVGIKGYTGWTAPQSVAPYATWRMLAIMAGEKTLQQAYDELPYSYKHQYLDTGDADLWVGKDDGLNLTLGGPVLERPQISIISPENGSTTTERTIVVQGNIIPWGANGTYGADATISVNGQSNALLVDNSGNFSHAVGLRVGENIIRVSVINIAETSKEVRVTGDFSSDVFWSQLSWNTNLNDIDLHMVPVEGADGKSDECYYGHKVSSWGAELDVDDVNGFGPEHITARSLPGLPAGKYKLYVHYYASHGQTQPAVVSVAVSANSSQAKVYTLPAMSSVDDKWEVCYITYPLGIIETINQYIPAGRGAVRSLPPKKK